MREFRDEMLFRKHRSNTLIHCCVVCAGAGQVDLNLPPSLPSIAGRVYVIKNFDVAVLTVLANQTVGDRVDDKTALAVRKKNAVTLIADGAGEWVLIAAVQ